MGLALPVTSAHLLANGHMALASLDGATRLAAMATKEQPTGEDWFKVRAGAGGVAPCPHPLLILLSVAPFLRSFLAATSSASGPSR